MKRRRRGVAYKPPDLTIDQILAWADEFFERVGRWPMKTDGKRCLADTTWSALNAGLVFGCRSLPGGSSLAKLLLECRGRRHKGLLPDLTTKQILLWADAYHKRHGKWPGQDSGPIDGAPGETWKAVEWTLRDGRRGIPGGSSLAQFLEVHRGARNHLALPHLKPNQILKWADAYRHRTGEWPHQSSGDIPEAPGENWQAVGQALLVGVRGLPGGSSIARLLAEKRGVRNPAAVPRMEQWEILAWADAFRERTGRWPTAKAGPIPESPGDTWNAVDSALYVGLRGLPGNDSLARLLARARGRRNHADLPDLSITQVLAWIDIHREETGEWPGQESGPIRDAVNETWRGIDKALRKGRRGLAGWPSLADLLEAKRGVRNTRTVPPLTIDQILEWADDYHARRGKWPKKDSGRIAGIPGETWSTVSSALHSGGRGLEAGSSLAQLLMEHRGVRNHMALPKLSEEIILSWADTHFKQHGRWPTRDSGVVVGALDESWASLESALYAGLRGLKGGGSLARLLAKHRGARNKKALPKLKLGTIRRWILNHFERTGAWPSRTSGAISESPIGDTWRGVEDAVYRGLRGFSPGGSLARLVDNCRSKHGSVQSGVP
jgi:hypothetical protein